MKRILTLAILAAFVLGCAGMASAVELKVDGEMKIGANYKDGWDGYKQNAGGQQNHFNIIERARIGWQFVMNENVLGYMQMEIGSFSWGNGAGQIDNDAIAIKVPRAYVQFKWPNTDVMITAGKLPAAYPDAGYFGSFIFDGNVTGVTVANQWNDMVGTTLAYFRAYNGDTNYRVAEGGSEIDLAMLAVPLTFDGVAATPFVSVGFLGNNASTTLGNNGLYAVNGTGARNDYEAQATPWWAGLGLKVDAFDPFVFYADFNWGQIDQKKNQNDREGWAADLAIEYTGFDMFVPSIYGTYATGIDDNLTNGDERMPTLQNVGAAWDGYAVGQVFYGGGVMLSDDIGNADATGTWNVGLKVANLSFVEKLSHNLMLTYIRGTNDADAVKKKGANLTYMQDLTDEDNIVEFNFQNTYQIYESLSAMVNYAYLWNGYDEDTWNTVNTNIDEKSDIWLLTVGVKYSF